MQLIEHRLLPGPAPPLAVLPDEGLGVDHPAGAVDALGLAAGGRVGHALAPIDAVLVETAGAGPIRNQTVPAPLLRDHGQRLLLIPAQAQLHPARLGGPEPEAD